MQERHGATCEEVVVSDPAEDGEGGVDPVSIAREIADHEMSDVDGVRGLEEPGDGPEIRSKSSTSASILFVVCELQRNASVIR